LARLKSSKTGIKEVITSWLAVLNNSKRSFAVRFLKFSNSAKSLKNFSFSCSKERLSSSYFVSKLDFFSTFFVSFFLAVYFFVDVFAPLVAIKIHF